MFVFLSKKNLQRNSALPWIIVFILMSILVRGTTGMNEKARYATMQSIVDEQTFNIDKNINWTVDWSKSPNGHYYSNKAPGPSLLLSPIYWGFNELNQLRSKDKLYNHNGKLKGPLVGSIRSIFMLLTQVIPFALLILFMGQQFRKSGFSPTSIRIFSLSILFCNTPVLFINSLSGHGTAAAFFLLAIYNLYKKDLFFLSLFLGMTFLTDYASVLSLPFIAAVLVWNERGNPKRILPILYGAIIPAILWIWYHTSAFGSPFLTSIQFPRAEFAFDSSNTASYAGGMFSTINFSIIFELLFGTKRGLMVTQPWVIGLVPILFFIKIKESNIAKHVKTISFILIGGLLLTIIMNSTFHGWHAGGSTGPRYLSYILMAFSLLLLFCYDNMGKIQKTAIWISITISLVFRMQVFGTHVLAPLENLWAWQWFEILSSTSAKPWIRMGAFLILMGIAFKIKKVYFLSMRRPKKSGRCLLSR